jgi:tripartite-type tricarboxylate transporter receptor subunit TctC
MRCLRMLAIVFAATLPFSGFAQTDYPTRPMRLIVPFTPGGGNDVLARVLADKLLKRWGQPVVVENRPGAGGNIGAEVVARSPADGYTLLLATNAMTIPPHITKSVPFDVRTDFAPIARLTTTPYALVVNSSKLPVKSIGEFVAFARAHPGRLSYASVGVGTPHHLGMEWFKLLTKIDVVHVPYRGSAPALMDLLAGQTQLMFITVNAIQAHIDKSELKALGVPEPKRISQLSDTPTIIEAGVAGFEFTAWYGVLVRAGTPAPVQGKLTQALLEIVNEPDSREKLVSSGFEITPAGPDEVQRLLHADYEKWGTIVRNAGIQPQ